MSVSSVLLVTCCLTHTFGPCTLSASVDADISEQDGLRYGQV